MRKLLSNLRSILKLTYQGWKEDHASQLSAALAYYTMFSLAPLLVIVIAITGLLWEADAVRMQILSQVHDLLGPQGADFIASLIDNTGGPAGNAVALILGIMTLLFGALGVFNELRNSLNIIWNVKVEKPEGFLQAVKKLLIDRFLSFAMILGIGFLLLVSLVITAGLSAAQKTIGNTFPLSDFMLQIVNLVISIGAITILFALLFKYLSDAHMAWHDVWRGAFVTALLFSIGKTAIGMYLGNSAVASIFGAAGSLVVLLLWIYYSAQILFFGAEFTQVYANTYGSKSVPEGKDETAQAASAALATTSGGAQLEEQNIHTGRVVIGMMIASFLTGIFTTIFGLKKR